MGLKILTLLKALVPKNKVGAWLLGIIAAGLALALSVAPDDLKEAFCAQPAVQLPAAEAPQAPAK
jgi:hypothetical protein